MSTLAELFPKDAKGPLKVRRKHWTGAYFECFFWSRSGHIFGRCSESGLANDYTPAGYDDWSLYQDPPKTKTVFEWMYRAPAGIWALGVNLGTEADAALWWPGRPYRKTGRSFEVEA